MFHGTNPSSIRPLGAFPLPRPNTWIAKLGLSGKPWMLVSLAIFIVATALYIPYAMHAEDGARGGTWPGLTYGIVASVALLIPMLIPLRNTFKALRVGKPATWMQAHIWFGTISYPLAIYHAGGFIWHGAFAVVMMWVFTGVIFSGVAILFLQRGLPTATALHALTKDRRHAARQRRLQAFLNGWLFIHVPLAYTLWVLVVIHAIMSIRFTSPG